MTDNGETSERARALLRDTVVCDMTLPWTGIPAASSEKKNATPGRFAAAGFDFITLTLAADNLEMADAIRAIARERRYIEARADRLVLVESVADLERARAGGNLGVGLHFQGTVPVGRNLVLVSLYYKLGIRHMLMSYNQKNHVGNGCHELGDDGLSRFGLELIAEMNRVGMVVDVAHCGYRTCMQAVEASTAPTIVSHGNVTAIYDHPRAYRDDQIKAVAQSGGVIGLTGLGIFMGENDASVGTYARSIDHVVQLVGPDHVGFGYDFVYDMPALTAFAQTMKDRWPVEGGYTRPDVAQIEPEQTVDIVAALMDMGYGDEDLRKIVGGNWLRVMTEVWKSAGSTAP